MQVQRILTGKKKILDNFTDKFENNSLEIIDRIISGNKNYSIKDYYMKCQTFMYIN